LGIVKLLGESSIGAGVRRVEALVGADAYKFLSREHMLLNSLTSLIKGSRAEELPEKIQGLLDKLRDIEKELAALRSAGALANISAIAEKVKSVGDFSYIGSVLADGISGEDLRMLALELRKSSPLSVIALISSTAGRPVLVSSVGDEARAKGVKAGSLVKIGSSVLGGGGGGKDDFAQGGGSDSTKANDAIAAIASALLGS
jgi:alanyl-tRNA synthetase